MAEINLTTPRKRTVKPLGPDGDALITDAKNQLKEAKKLAKIIDTIKDLGNWGLERIESAITARRETLSAKT